MAENALLARSEPEALSAALQQRIREFTSFYERHAYLVYNLVLRTTCDAEAAHAAAQQAFLSQLNADPAGLLASAVEAGLAVAPRRPDLRGAGDADATRLMEAMSQLPAVDRAALALADLADAAPEEVGQCLGVPADQAARILARAREALGHQLGLSPDAAGEGAERWMWAAPPNEVWEQLYPRFHTAVEDHLRRDAAELTLVLRRDDPAAPSSQTRTASRRLRSAGRRRRLTLPRLRRRAFLAIVPVLLLVGGAAAQQLVAGGSTGASAPSSGAFAVPPPAPPSETSQSDARGEGAKPHKPLTAELLDKLRLRELRQLRAYTKRQADRSLPARQRRAAARRVAALERAARARLRAQRRREAALRDREARARAREEAPPPPPAMEPRRPQSKPAPARTEDPGTPAGPPRNREEAEQTCLQDQDTGQFVCPR